MVAGEVLDTLLGPEGSGDAVLGLLLMGGSGGVPAGFFWSWASPRSQLAVVGVGCRLYFENFTVDASIFVVFKFLRAHGGCLGTRNRRRT